MKLFDDDPALARPPRPDRAESADAAPRTLAEVHAVAHRMTCLLPGCGAGPREWCRDTSRHHHLERYFRAHQGGLISNTEIQAVVELSKPQENSYTLIRID